MKELISIIVPCYNEEKALPHYYNKMKEIMNNMNYVDFEIILVNDGSKDNTLKEMQELARNDARIKFINFSKNFGKEAAMYAGFEYSKGDFIAVMDADLQDPPELLEEMYKGMGDGARDYRLMTRQMLNAILSMKEYNRYSKGLFSFVGFDTKWLEYENVERVAGETHWSFWKLFKYALEGITAFSTVPLVMSSIIGIIFFFISIIAIIYIIINTLMYGNPTSGWPSMICIIFMVTGIQLFCIGIIGQYLSKVYLEVKNRPIYIVKDTNIK